MPNHVPTGTQDFETEGVQLPHADIVQQVPATDPPPMPFQPYLRRWMQWAQLCGPKMNPVHRLVLVMISSFADEQGEAIVSQDILAYLVDYSRQRVNGVIQELARLGFLQVRKEPRADGRYEYNVYRLSAADGEVASPKGVRSRVMTSQKMIVALGEALAAILQVVEEHGIEVESADDIVELLKMSDMDTKKRELEVSMSLHRDMVYGDPSPPEPKLSEIVENLSPEPTSVPVPTRRELVERFVENNEQEICGDKPGQIHYGRNSAIVNLMKPGELERWERKLNPKPKERDQRRHSRDYERYRGGMSSQLSAEWTQVVHDIFDLAAAGMPAEDIYDHVTGPDGSELSPGSVERVLSQKNFFSSRTRGPSRPMTLEEAQVQGGFESLTSVFEKSARQEY